MRARPRGTCVTACATLLVVLISGCGDDDDGSGSGTEADRIGVGAECRNDADCPQTGDGGIVQHCLTEFRGGYCGLKDCTSAGECPFGSACVAHDNGTNYCFRICRDKGECNLNRSPENESNCSSNIDFVGGDQGAKACVPPSSG